MNVLTTSKKNQWIWGILFPTVLFMGSCTDQTDQTYQSPYVEILFLGHNSEHHHSEQLMPMLAASILTKGIHLTYTSNPDDLNDENLAKYDGLALYANHDSITSSQEQSLLKFVESGKGFIGIHCASYCFRNSTDFIEMLGGQFKDHGEGRFNAVLTQQGQEHAINPGLFETWDETYTHQMINPDITVLMERVEGDYREPYTWVNSVGKGRVFYTAYGHDERTWSNPGFQNLVAEGILWAVGDQVAAKTETLKFPNLQFTEAKIPNYEKRDPPLKLQQPLSPQESEQLTQVPVGFSWELFASEPDIINPIAFSWDEKGRLWVIETVDYPNTVRQEEGDGDDRIKICEDTDGDGRADKFTVFAENLNIPTSMVFANDGIIVSQAPHFLFLQDTDGDDQADVRKVINTGWGISDTHAGPSNLRYGFDNKIWGTVGYSGYEGEVDGMPLKLRSGIFRFNPDGSGLQHVASTTNNTWGLGFSENFDVFASTANNNHSVHIGIFTEMTDGIRGLKQNMGEKIDGHYAMHPITQQVRQVDVFGGFTAAAGHSLYTARAFPKEYWNRIAFVCEPTGRLVHNAIMEPHGSGFSEKDGWNLVASNDNWFGPVQTEVGPDGAVWVADWYNFIIQHNPTPPGFENGAGNAHINPLRDRKHGRIYRLAFKGATPYQPLALSKDDPKGLISALQHPNLFWRLTAQRLLVELGEQNIVPELLQLIADQSVDELGINPGAIHALWTLNGMGLLEPGMSEEIREAALSALKHPSPGVRKAAIQTLPVDMSVAEAALESGIFKDPDLNTRLAAILVLSRIPAVEGIGDLLLEQSLDPQVLSDHRLARAVYIASANHRKAFTTALSDHPALSKKLNQQDQKTDSAALALDVSDWGKLSESDLSIAEVLVYHYAADEMVAGQDVNQQAGKGVTTVEIGVIENEMKFDINSFEVDAGTQVEIIFKNTDFMQHNLLIVEPGSLQTVGEAADKLAMDPNGASRNYIPDLPQVLYATKLVDPREEVRLLFTAPEEPGEYPFLCTFPGHWRIMNGIITVKPSESKAI